MRGAKQAGMAACRLLAQTWLAGAGMAAANANVGFDSSAGCARAFAPSFLTHCVHTWTIDNLFQRAAFLAEVRA